MSEDGSNKEGLSEKEKADLDSLSFEQELARSGLGGGAQAEGLPKFIKTPSENVIEGSNNASIVLGRDRPSSRFSGYGGKGHTHCGTIDMVSGRMGSEAKSTFNFFGSEKPVFTDPHFKNDAARIYVSQRTDIDENFKIVEGVVGQSVGRSAVGIKADAVRIIGREGIKIVTGTDENHSLGEGASFGGIDLIAGNDDVELQPLVKGENLILLLDLILKEIESLSGMVYTFAQIQEKFNDMFLDHWHTSPFDLLETTPPEPGGQIVPEGFAKNFQLNVDVMLGLMSQRFNIATTRQAFLDQTGDAYINSRYNNTN